MTKDKKTNNIHPIHSLIEKRWSTRSFDPERTISDEDLNSLIEAARWAPSSYNDQPWKFLVAKRDDPNFQRIAASLFEFNQLWSTSASAYIVVAGVKNRADGTPNPAYAYDCGQAVSFLTIEATHRDLVLHQMGGYDKAKLQLDLKISESLDPVVVIALGYHKERADLHENLKQLEALARERKPQAEILL